MTPIMVNYKLDSLNNNKCLTAADGKCFFFNMLSSFLFNLQGPFEEVSTTFMRNKIAYNCIAFFLIGIVHPNMFCRTSRNNQAPIMVMEEI